MSRVLEIAQGQRRTGRTTALVRGVIASENAILVVHDRAYADLLVKEFPGLHRKTSTIATALQDTRGRRCTVVFDHAVIEQEIQAIIRELNGIAKSCGSFETYLINDLHMDPSFVSRIKFREFSKETGEFRKI